MRCPYVESTRLAFSWPNRADRHDRLTGSQKHRRVVVAQVVAARALR
jgi:hypothetical protein